VGALIITTCAIVHVTRDARRVGAANDRLERARELRQLGLIERRSCVEAILGKRRVSVVAKSRKAESVSRIALHAGATETRRFFELASKQQ
jgi:hypothetical protein